jgi:hypothetical protein
VRDTVDAILGRTDRILRVDRQSVVSLVEQLHGIIWSAPQDDDGMVDAAHLDSALLVAFQDWARSYLECDLSALLEEARA